MYEPKEIWFGAVESLGTFGAKASLQMLFGVFAPIHPQQLWLGGRRRIYKCRGITNVLIFEPPDRLFSYGLFVTFGGVVDKTIYSFIVFICICCTSEHVFADCSPGYYPIQNSMGDTIIAPMDGMCSGGYRLQDVPDVIRSSNGYSKSTEIPICDGYWTGTTCNPDTSPDCLSGQHGIFYDHVVMAPMDGGCDAGYRLLDMNDGFVLTNGFVTVTEIPLGTVSYSQGDCPDGYFDLSVSDSSFFAVNTSGACSGGYQYITEQCKQAMPDSPVTCGILCEYGLEYTAVGTCSQLCSGAHSTLRTSTGLVYPMYATKSVTPSLNIRVGDTACYVNLIPGAESNAINIKHNNKTYHAVK